MDITWGVWAEGGGGIQEEDEGVDVTWGITNVGGGGIQEEDERG